jgi:hypothetical protein
MTNSFKISFNIDTTAGSITNVTSIPVNPIPQPPQPIPIPTPQPIPIQNSRIPIKLSGDLSVEQQNTILGLVSIAENSSINWWDQYTYCENIGDGRGYTAGFYGFCSGTGDMLQVFQNLKTINPNHALVKYIPILVKVNNSSSTVGLENLVSDCKKYCNVE